MATSRAGRGRPARRRRWTAVTYVTGAYARRALLHDLADDVTVCVERFGPTTWNVRAEARGRWLRAEALGFPRRRDAKAAALAIGAALGRLVRRGAVATATRTKGSMR